MSSSNKFKPNRRLDEGDVHVENTDQVFITTTEDKLTLRAQEFIVGTKARHSWGTPLGIVLTIAIALLTAEFKDSYGLKGIHIEAGFWGVLIFSLFWLLRCLWRLCFNHSKGDVDNFKSKIKQPE